MLTSRKLMVGLFAALMVMTLAFSAGLFSLQSAHAAGASWNPAWKILPGEPTSSVTRSQQASSPLPTWSSSFTYNATTYPYTMIGTNPANGSATTTVPTLLIPLKMVFSNGDIINATKKVTAVKNSPIFQNATFGSGTTQFGDAMQRADFWKTVNKKAPNYHVLLGTPTVVSTVTINVPAADGIAGTTSSGILIGEVDLTWFTNTLIGMLGQHGITPANLPIFLTDNIGYYFNGNPNDCCWFGFHAQTTSGSTVQTYIAASYMSAGVQTGLQDVSGLSHEIAEWINDPFGNNTVPNWTVASQPSLCSNLLEVGDPLEGVIYTEKAGTTIYHLQDIAFLSWFARQSPSTAIKGKYTYKATYTTYSTSC